MRYRSGREYCQLGVELRTHNDDLSMFLTLILSLIVSHRPSSSVCRHGAAICQKLDGLYVIAELRTCLLW
jgi:hypothetical protein